MVKHNNVVPNAHFHKKWATSSRGPLKVVTWFDQPAKKKQRRLRRAAKAAKIAPKPLARLRPSVICPTARYAGKLRLGRGFTLEEVKAAGLAPAFARTIGIAVDHRRVNKCEESLARNVERLKQYKAKLILFPRKGQQPKEGEATEEQMAEATQYEGVVMPLEPPKKAESVDDVEFVELTDEMKEASAYATHRTARNELKLKGVRIKMAKAKDDKAK